MLANKSAGVRGCSSTDRLRGTYVCPSASGDLSACRDALLLKSRFWVFGARDLQEPLDVPIAAFDVCLTPSLPLAGRDMLASADKLLAGAQAVVSSPTFSLENQFDMPVDRGGALSSDGCCCTSTSSRPVLATANSIAAGASMIAVSSVTVSLLGFAHCRSPRGVRRAHLWLFSARPIRSAGRRHWPDRLTAGATRAGSARARRRDESAGSIRS
jgi:hypothetical protein